MKRRDFLYRIGIGTAGLAAAGFSSRCRRNNRRPNIIYILADDLGYGELGCYGQDKIRTPHLDRMAAEGMRLTQHYSGSPVCAPSRCTLMTGKHTGHAYIRDNDEMAERGDVWNDESLEGQRPLLPGTTTLATLLRSAGYRTGATGKWGLGGPGTSGAPNRQGFDFFYGYLCQRQAHSYYPSHLWRNSEKEVLPGNADGRQEQYSHDLITEEALGFIRRNRERPFFLYLPFTIPHVSLQVPEDSLREYLGLWPETPYPGAHYAAHLSPRAAYAAMITRMDRDIGRVFSLLKELNLDENTLVVFSSDNGPTYTAGVDYEFFNSAGSLRGLKGRLYEGGIRVPMIARWPNHIPRGAVSDHVSAFWDILPTLCEAADVRPPEDTDGISLLPALLGQGIQPAHDALYWEFRSYGGQQAVRMGDWKGIRTGLLEEDADTRIQLYDLKTDPSETTDLADRYPGIVEKLSNRMATMRTESGVFPFPEIRTGVRTGSGSPPGSEIPKHSAR